MISVKAKLTISLTVVSTVLGFMVALQYRQTEPSRILGTNSSYSDAEEKRLEAQLSALKSSNNAAQQQLASLTAKLTDYERESSKSSSSMQAIQARLEDERILAGITPVEGPGITVTLMDGQGADTPQVITHDWDVRQVINELFTAGAEAVSINGYRVVATSGIYCRGPVVTINNHRIGAPFVIEAIGDPNTLKSALDMPGGILDWLRTPPRGVQVSEPKEQTKIVMPAFTLTPTAPSSDAADDNS